MFLQQIVEHRCTRRRQHVHIPVKFVRACWPILICSVCFGVSTHKAVEKSHPHFPSSSFCDSIISSSAFYTKKCTEFIWFLRDQCHRLKWAPEDPFSVDHHGKCPMPVECPLAIVMIKRRIGRRQKTRIHKEAHLFCVYGSRYGNDQSVG